MFDYAKIATAQRAYFTNKAELADLNHLNTEMNVFDEDKPSKFILNRSNEDNGRDKQRSEYSSGFESCEVESVRKSFKMKELSSQQVARIVRYVQEHKVTQIQAAKRFNIK